MQANQINSITLPFFFYLKMVSVILGSSYHTDICVCFSNKFGLSSYLTL